ncbi:KAP-like P-loop domain-containing protein [Promicromonospora sp. AC04]|uniref:P-loop NTPase fold protein n=1 Tax=Promicromonospora sp. AC04 TaxID=2135723 RepID=UPI000D4E7412|nr:P-loop NTPase fold protein [Promicromonospora sp. AC04]PUB26123.1 KAP-like P-loop domain-containing protein [Promicromonospora sp. AC04]
MTSTGVRDDLGLRPHVEALAHLVTARTAPPSYAVAVLGEWGGGKSAFLRRLQVQVEARAASGDPESVASVRVVRWNAWAHGDTSVLVGIAAKVVAALRGEDVTGRRRGPLDARLRARRRTATTNRAERMRARAARLDHRIGAAEDASVLGTVLHQARVLLLLPWALFRSGWRRALPLTIVFVVAGLFVVGPALLPVFAHEVAPDVAAWLAESGTWVSGVLASSGLVAALTALVAGYRSRVAELDPLRTGMVGTLAQLVLVTFDQERAKAEARLGELDADDAIDGLSVLLHDDDHQGRLERAHGFVGNLQDELGTFADQLAKAGEHLRRPGDTDADGRVERIVLHVDDLDRCPPDRVVDVLQALTLLLSTSLFVIVVAADPRTLRHALERDSAAATRLEGHAAGALDHLDALFQVPYALPRLVPPVSGRYLLRTAADQGLLPLDLALDPGDDDAPAGDPPSSTLSAREAELLALVCEAVTTPRAAKKLLTLYQLVRYATGPDDDPRPAALLLALLVGAPEQAAQLLGELDDRPDAAHLTAVIETLGGRHASAGHERCAACAAWRRMRGVAERAVAAGVPAEVGSYRAWAREVARFSFHTTERH